MALHVGTSRRGLLQLQMVEPDSSPQWFGKCKIQENLSLIVDRDGSEPFQRWLKEGFQMGFNISIQRNSEHTGRSRLDIFNQLHPEPPMVAHRLGWLHGHHNYTPLWSV